MYKKFSCFIGILLLLSLSAFAKDYNGAELYSKSSIKYGRFDVRMRAVSGSGIVSSFFLYYNDSYLGAPEPWQEVDIEVMGKNNEAFQSNIITGTSESKKTSEEMHTFDNLSITYHTYTVEWTPDYIAWYFDGEEIRRTTGSQVAECQPKDMSYRFNLWISDAASWAGSFDPSILPVYQFINWMQYSAYTPGSGVDGTDFTPEWKDDFDSFNSTRWAKGDWTFGGNLVDFSPDNIVVQDGYCIICLTSAAAKGFSGDVPEDHGTSIASRKPHVLHTGNVSYPSAVTVMLNGRLVPVKSDNSRVFKSNLLIGRDKNSVSQKVYFLK